MSLVAYGSSDESSEDEGTNCDIESDSKVAEEPAIKRTNDKLCLPTPKHNVLAKETNENIGEMGNMNGSPEKIHFDTLPKPRNLTAEREDMVEEDDIPPKKEIESKVERPTKKDRAPVKITVPCLSEFKDLDEESGTKCSRIRPSTKGTKLFALLPPPKGVELKSTKLIPSVMNKAVAKTNQTVKAKQQLSAKDSHAKKPVKPVTTKSSIGISYDSNSEDEGDGDTIADDGATSTTDFFALTTTEPVAAPLVTDTPSSGIHLSDKSSDFDSEIKNDSNDSNTVAEETYADNSQKTLVSNIMNLPKEEILLKNKAEVGPKLPVPEQEYNIDVEGNVAFDDKAIEYLCGRRGVKRKAKEIETANIIEISGEDIKPDEREWLVKALTEEPVQRPVSMQSGGVSSQSKKKHQITYLAHQAKAMEMELKNQWAQNRMTRKQTQSKYGF